MSTHVKNFRLRKKHVAALFLSISVVVGVVRFVLYLIPPSKPEDQLIFGLSAARAFLGIIFLGLLLINIGAVLFTLIDFGPRQKKLKQQLSNIFSNYHTLIMMALYGVLAVVGAFFLLSIPPIIRPLRFLEPHYIRLSGFLSWILIADLLLIIMLRMISAEMFRNSQSMRRLDTVFIGVGIFVLTSVLYLRTAILIGWIDKTVYSFWDLLVGQFIQGKLYLENPAYTHDLTLYNGRWYVPMPPLPGIMLIPIALWIGAENISTSYFSMLLSALNGLLLFLILKQMAQRKWVRLSGHSMFWLIVLFLFGTPHLWLGISGRGWYVSQIVTVLFLSLAIYAALRWSSPWLSGTFLAIAMLARPNSLMSWPFIFAISMQVMKEKGGSVTWRQAINWTAKTALPIAATAVVLLTYNYLRFENILDFGYTTVNAGPDVVRNVQAHGMFSPHFVPNNLYVMFLKPPRINWGTPWPTEPKGALWPIDPTTTGMSILLTTPPLLYLFRRYPKAWWILGGWVAVLFNVIMLSTYHNTGAHQFGYRYIMDFLVPLVMLLAVGIGKKVPWHFIVLVLVSIVINLYGAYWFMNG
ncbi:MAG: hypothetical protein WBL25_05560 [Anaerolineales bacterium]